MSMNEAALKHVQKTANYPELIKQIKDLGIDDKVALIPDDMSLKSLEPQHENRFSFRASFKTSVIDDFVNYAMDSVNPEYINRCYIDPESMAASIIFDVGTMEKPKHGNHKANVRLEKTAPFKALLDVDGEPMTQKRVSDWIEDNDEFIQVFDTVGTPMKASAAAAAVRRMTVEAIQKIESEVSDFGQSMSAMDEISVRAENQQPAAIKFNCIPYVGLSERTFEMRISARSSGREPVLILSIRSLEIVKEQMADEFKGIIAGRFEDTEIKTMIGNFSM